MKDDVKEALTTLRRVYGPDRYISPADLRRELDGMDMARRAWERMQDAAPADPTPSAPQRPAPPPGDASSAYVLDALGRVSDDDTFEEPVTPQERDFATREEIHGIRESAYVRHCRNRAGDVMDAKAYEESAAAREQLADDTLTMAFKLQSVGRRAFADPAAPVAMIVCPLTGRFHVMPNVAARKIFPTVAAAKRAKTVLALELLLSRPEHEHDLFWTFTMGTRPTVDRLRAAFRALHRKLSKLNAEPFMREAGASFIFRTSEVGSLTKWVRKDTGEHVHILDRERAGDKKWWRIQPADRLRKSEKVWIRRKDLREAEHRDESGAFTYHPHAHCLMHLERKIDDARMATLTGQIRDWWGSAWCGLAGGIRKVREVTKYCAKPADLRLLSGHELAALDDALLRLHLVQPMGELRDQIRARREACLIIKRETRIVGEGCDRRPEKVLVVLPDWNARKKRRYQFGLKEAERIAARAKADPRAVPAEMLDHAKKLLRAETRRKIREETARLRAEFDANFSDAKPTQGDLFAPPTQNAEKPTENAQEPAPGTRPVIRNRVVARLSPAPYFDQVSTPALLVWNFDGSAEALAEIQARPFVAEVIAATRERVARARASLVSVHTSPVTVRDPRPGFLPGLCRRDAWPPPPVPDPVIVAN